jgi:hypothetical protein
MQLGTNRTEIALKRQQQQQQKGRYVVSTSRKLTGLNNEHDREKCK